MKLAEAGHKDLGAANLTESLETCLFTTLAISNTPIGNVEPLGSDQTELRLFRQIEMA